VEILLAAWWQPLGSGFAEHLEILVVWGEDQVFNWLGCCLHNILGS
jgi:hypothetical protein